MPTKPMRTLNLSLTTDYQPLDLSGISHEVTLSFWGNHSEDITLSIDEVGSITEYVPASSRELAGPLLIDDAFTHIKAAGATSVTITVYAVKS